MPLAVETKDFLATWAESRFGDGPFTPSLKDKQELVAETGLDKRQVENWIFRYKKNKASDYFRTWANNHLGHPYPSPEEKERMAADTGLNMKQVANWFTNYRIRYWKGKGDRGEKKARTKTPTLVNGERNSNAQVQPGKASSSGVGVDDSANAQGQPRKRQASSTGVGVNDSAVSAGVEISTDINVPKKMKLQDLQPSATTRHSLNVSPELGTHHPLRNPDEQRPRGGHVLIPIADGVEELSLTSCSDVLARFGATAVTAKVPSFERVAEDQIPRSAGGDRSNSTTTGEYLVCTTTSGLRIVAETSIRLASRLEWDAIVLPGGLQSAMHMRCSEELMSLIGRHRKALRLYGAIGESPAIVLGSSGLLSLLDEGRGATCFPNPRLRSEIPDPVDKEVVIQGNLVTAIGAGASLKFALAVGGLLSGKDKANEVAKELLVNRPDPGLRNKSKILPIFKTLRSSSKPRSDEYAINEGELFLKVIWPALDRLGWTIENRPKGCGRGGIYCPPGVKRDKDGYALMEENQSVSCFECIDDVIDFLLREPRLSNLLRRRLRVFHGCFIRLDDCVDMGKFALNSFTMSSIIVETERNADVLEVPLFDAVILPQLLRLRWTTEKGRSRNRVTYFLPGVKRDGTFKDGIDFFGSRQQVLDFLIRSDTWGSMESILSCMDVYQACISVGNDNDGQEKVDKDNSPMGLYLQARRKRPALPRLNYLLNPQLLEEVEDNNPKKLDSGSAKEGRKTRNDPVG